MKLILSLITLIVTVSTCCFSYAAPAAPAAPAASASSGTSSSSSASSTSSPLSRGKVAQDNLEGGWIDNMCIKTYTTEPGGVFGEDKNCTPVSGTGQTARYQCTICGSNAFVEYIANIYKFIFYICLILGVLLMVVMGIGISLSGIASEEVKSKAKAKIMDILLGLIGMALIPWILKTLVPFFFKG